MVTMEEYAVILTHSTSHSIRIEKLLLADGFRVEMIPVPRHLSSDCGTCVKIRSVDLEKARGMLEEKNIPFDRIEHL
jgi:hypothetical protein